MDDNSIYLELSKRLLSYNCERQGELFLQEAEKYLSDDFTLKHSLIRLAVRPLYYAGFAEDDFFLWLKGRSKCDNFWGNNYGQICAVFKELKLCEKYYGSDYDRTSFFDDFRKLGIEDDEIERIYSEETGL